MQTYTKLFSRIIHSSIWDCSASTRLVWVTMLAMADQDGEVFGSVGGLSRAARVTHEECVEALEAFLAPDADSSNPDNDGRRIVKVPGGWRLLNHAVYREMTSSLDAQSSARRRQKAYRERQKADKRNALRHGITRDNERQRVTTNNASDQIRSDHTNTTTPPAPSKGEPPTPRKSPKAPRKPSEADVRSAVKQLPALQAIPGFEGEVLAWWAALGAKKRWASVGALTRRLRWLDQRADRAVELVRVARDERWTDPVHAEKVLDRGRPGAGAPRSPHLT